MEPDIKFGDILKYSQEWFDASGASETKRKIRFVATGRIMGEEPDWLICVARENSSYLERYHHTFLEKA